MELLVLEMAPPAAGIRDGPAGALGKWREASLRLGVPSGGGRMRSVIPEQKKAKLGGLTTI